MRQQIYIIGTNGLEYLTTISDSNILNKGEIVTLYNKDETDAKSYEVININKSFIPAAGLTYKLLEIQIIIKPCEFKQF